jgi:hypothetical protein
MGDVIHQTFREKSASELWDDKLKDQYPVKKNFLDENGELGWPSLVYKLFEARGYFKYHQYDCIAKTYCAGDFSAKPPKVVWVPNKFYDRYHYPNGKEGEPYPIPLIMEKDMWSRWPIDNRNLKKKFDLFTDFLSFMKRAIDKTKGI